MRKLLLFTFFTGGSIMFCLGQTNSNIVPAANLQSQKTPAAGHNQPSTGINSSLDKNTGSDSKSNADEGGIKSQTQVEKNDNQYLEYKVDERSNPFTTKGNQQDEQKIILPIQAEGYTDPNYEVNKKKSEEVIEQLNANEAPAKTDAELILELQNQIKAIKDGVVVDPVSVNKLSFYEEELQSLLNKKK